MQEAAPGPWGGSLELSPAQGQSQLHIPRTVIAAFMASSQVHGPLGLTCSPPALPGPSSPCRGAGRSPQPKPDALEPLQVTRVSRCPRARHMGAGDGAPGGVGGDSGGGACVAPS